MTLRLSVPEYGRIRREVLGPVLLRRLQTFDERTARTPDGGIFDWSRVHYVRARNHVGVVQVPGLAVEILPKVNQAQGEEASEKTNPAQRLAQNNLLYMLSVSHRVPLQERDLSDQRLQKMTLLDALGTIFLRRLLLDLRRGRDRGYLLHEKNLSWLKGKLLMTQHVRLNAARRDRFFVGYDEFVDDTWLNRILKSACRLLLRILRSNRGQQLAREAILELADVEDIEIREHHFEKVQVSRGSERFRRHLEFARLIISGRTPAPSLGGTRTFSLLFPMDRLFEEFVGQFLRRYAAHFGLERTDVHLQAVHHRRWLLRALDGKGRFRLKPDVLVVGPDLNPKLVLDTKWKRLQPDAENLMNGVSQADIYQLYAYANQYRCPDNVVLYPAVPGATAKAYRLDGDDARRSVRIEFIDLSRDLRQERDRLLNDFRRVVVGDANAHEVESQPVPQSTAPHRQAWSASA